jgi:rRNA-processing protein FCF1
MRPPVYVIDTNALVWFAKGLVGKFNLNAFVALIHPRARVVVPSYVLEEIGQKFRPFGNNNNSIKIPPSALLRTLVQCSNAKLLPRGAAVQATEFRLMSRVNRRLEEIDKQDIPIAAATLVVQECCGDPVVLITSDGKLIRWASTNGVHTLGPHLPFRFLPS